MNEHEGVPRLYEKKLPIIAHAPPSTSTFLHCTQQMTVGQLVTGHSRVK